MPRLFASLIIRRRPLMTVGKILESRSARSLAPCISSTALYCPDDVKPTNRGNVVESVTASPGFPAFET